ALSETPEVASLVYRTLDTLGRTRWRINRSVLEVAIQARDAGIALPGLPQPAVSIEPPRPPDIADNPAGRKAWREAKARMIEAHLAHVGRVLQSRRVLAEAERLSAEP